MFDILTILTEEAFENNPKEPQLSSKNSVPVSEENAK